MNIQAQSEVDSLKNLLTQTIADSVRVDVLGMVGWKLQYKDANQAIGYAEESLTLVKKLESL